MQQKLELKEAHVRSKRLPPGQTEAKGTPLRQIGQIPKSDLTTWRLNVYGDVEKPKTFSFNDLKSQPSVVSVSDFHCVEGWSILNNKWEGTTFKTLARIVKPKQNAMYVTFECEDGYTTSLPLSELLQDNVLLAYKLNDKQLTLERGGPLRLIIPSKYAYKSPKWIQKIKLTQKQELGYWETRGYSNTANAWKQERHSK